MPPNPRCQDCVFCKPDKTWYVFVAIWAMLGAGIGSTVGVILNFPSMVIPLAILGGFLGFILPFFPARKNSFKFAVCASSATRNRGDYLRNLRIQYCEVERMQFGTLDTCRPEGHYFKSKPRSKWLDFFLLSR